MTTLCKLLFGFNNISHLQSKLLGYVEYILPIDLFYIYSNYFLTLNKLDYHQ